jgi:MoaA/NifB/PqqE/SkfB family radical SAM enzyme
MSERTVSLPLLGTIAAPTGPISPLDLRILSHYPQLRAIERGEIPFPRTAILYPVYGCNLDCVGCEYAADNSDGLTFFPERRLISLLHELADVGVEGVELCGGGEPTLHPGFAAAVEEGGRRGLRFGLLTNGTAFTERLLERVARHLSYVRVTFDAADEAVYSVVRPSKGKSPWPNVLEGFSALLRARRDGSPREVSVKFLVNRHNRHQIAEAADLALRLGADGIQFKALRHDPAALTPEETIDAERAIVDARACLAPFPVTGTVQKTTMHRSCKLTPLQVTIDAYGDVFLCCYYTLRRERHTIGSILEQPFRQLWGSRRHREAIAGITPKECSVFDCRFVRYHDVLEAWTTQSGDGLSFL